MEQLVTPQTAAIPKPTMSRPYTLARQCYLITGDLSQGFLIWSSSQHQDAR